MKRYLCWILIVGCILSLCSCGSKPKLDDTDTGSAVVPGDETQETEVSNQEGAQPPRPESNANMKYLIEHRSITAYGNEAESYDEYSWDENQKTLTRTHYRVSRGENNTHTGDTTVYSFDENGKVIEESVTDYNGAFDNLIRYQYDDAENMVKKETYNANDMLAGYTAYEYDDGNRLLKEEEFDAFGKGKLVATYHYDSNGNKVRFNDFSMQGNCMSFIIYEYDEDNLLVAETQYALAPNRENFIDLSLIGDAIKSDPFNDELFTFDWKKVYQYDKEGRLIYWEQCDEQGNLSTGKYTINYDEIVREAKEYDGHGNVIKWETYDLSNDRRDRVAYDYDELGSVTAWYRLDDDGMRIEPPYQQAAYTYDAERVVKAFYGSNWEEWEYDDNGNETRYTAYNADGEKIAEVLTDWIPVPEYIYNFACEIK